MTTKLTLSIDIEKVKKIKRISKNKKRSVSKLIEDYIDELDKKIKKKILILTKLPELLEEFQRTLMPTKSGGNN